MSDSYLLTATVSIVLLSIVCLESPIHDIMTQVTVQRARLGGAPPARRMKYVRIDEEVQRLTQRFDSDEITAMDFIAGLRRVIHHY